MRKYRLNSDEHSQCFAQVLSMVPMKYQHIEFVMEATITHQVFVCTLLKEEVSNNKISALKASVKGEKILLLLSQLFFIIPDASNNIQLIHKLAVSTALWVAKREGTISELTMIVNGISAFANNTRINKELEELYEVSLYVLFATDPYVKADTQKLDAQRPWRLLCLNHCIIATRTGNRSIAHSAYHWLLKYLPEEVDMFFKLALQKVATGDYPLSLVNTVKAYSEMYCNVTTHCDNTNRCLLINNSLNTVH